MAATSPPRGSWRQESSDGGLTWGGHRVITDTAPGDVNVYSPNLIRAQDGGILLLFHRNHGKDTGGGACCTLYAWKSLDEGRTFAPFAELFARREHQLCNATVKRLASGRLLLPVSPAVPGRSRTVGQIRRHCPSQRRRWSHLERGRQPTYPAQARRDGAARRAGRRWSRPDGDAQPARHAAPLRVHRRRPALVQAKSTSLTAPSPARS